MTDSPNCKVQHMPHQHSYASTAKLFRIVPCDFEILHCRKGTPSNAGVFQVPCGDLFILPGTENCQLFLAAV